MIFVETTGFTNILTKMMSDDEYSALQAFLITHPGAGKIIRGSGGMRKLRWAVQGKGKSGGARIIYYWMPRKEHIYLLTAYTKGDRENIDAATLKQISKFLETLK